MLKTSNSLKWATLSLSTRAASTGSLKLEYLDSADWNKARTYNEIPGPTKYELFRGFLPGGQYYDKSFTEYIMHARKQYGDTFKIPGTLGKVDVVMLFNVDDIQKVFRTEGIWPNRPGMDSMAYYRKKYRSELYDKAEGLIASEGKAWSTFRTAVNPVLMQPRNAKTYVIPMQEVNNEFLQRIRDIRDPITHEVPDNFIDEINRLTFESVSVVALDKELGLIRKNRDRADAKELFKNLQIFLQYVYELDFKPSAYKYVWTPTFARYKKALDGIYETIFGYVEETLQQMEKKNLENSAERELSVLEKLLKIDKSIAIVMAMDLLMAGVDTTSTAISGILLEVATNPEKQQKLREEVRKVLPQKDSTFTVESMKNLPYLRSCIKEGLRMHPIGVGIPRTAGDDIALGGYQIPKGTRVLSNSNLLLREKNFFPRPNEFIPERWIRDGPLETVVTPFSYLPFGFGPRMCVGRRIVDLEMEVTVARLVRNFYMEFNYPTENAFKGQFLNTPAIPLKFKFTEVEN
ncbi:cytochrome P450 CYP12A2-like [Episyrphus balteatus]|uniref:cytochrome P450 CYP12A2-like n=1 Tax=Episyrphus balteatus TaxID=286459 RepID=UPI0024866301|nr:cytochrome P450 CYP12A2-like [Episyrphus balteatus]